MVTLRTLIAAAVMSAASLPGALAQKSAEDPYQILNRYFNAAGGLANLKAESTQYMEGNISLAGLEGTIKSWIAKPDRSRIEADLGIFKMTQADNGEYEWTLDMNGKLQKITNPDQVAVKRKEVKRRVTNYEYADPQSDVFEVAYTGREKVDDKECLALKITNNINDDNLTYYINADNFLLEKAVSIEGDNSNDQYFSDYRKVGELLVPYRIKQVAHATGQEQDIAVVKYISNLDIDPTIFDPPGETEKDYRFTDGESSENIPMRFVENHLFIPVIVDCRERYWVLDTGAALSVISFEFADELGLEKQGNLKGLGAGGTVDIAFTVLPSFKLQGLEFDEQTVAMIDMTELNRLLAIPVAGILGYDFLSRFVTKVDFANESVSFYDPEAFQYMGDGHEIGLHLKDNVFSVDATLDGIHQGSWLFDLGASSTSLHGGYALREGYASMKGVTGMGRGAGHAFATKRVNADKFDFAGYAIENTPVTFSYGGTDSSFFADRIGTLGNTLFRHFVIYCDYANERLIVEKGDDFDRIFPENNSGMQLTRGDNGNIEVLYVAEKAPAHKAGFHQGDIIKSINGIQTSRFDGIAAVRKMLTEPPGTEYSFVIEREGIEKKLKLKLAELL